MDASEKQNEDVTMTNITTHELIFHGIYYIRSLGKRLKVPVRLNYVEIVNMLNYTNRECT